MIGVDGKFRAAAVRLKNFLLLFISVTVRIYLILIKTYLGVHIPSGRFIYIKSNTTHWLILKKDKKYELEIWNNGFFDARDVQ